MVYDVLVYSNVLDHSYHLDSSFDFLDFFFRSPWGWDQGPGTRVMGQLCLVSMETHLNVTNNPDLPKLHE